MADFHKNNRLTLRMSDESKRKLKDLSTKYGYLGVSNFLTDLVIYAYKGNGCSEVKGVKKFIYDIYFESFLNNEYDNIPTNTTNKEIQKAVSYIGRAFGESILYSMVCNGYNDIMDYLNNASEKWVDWIQLALHEKMEISLDKRDVTLALRIWYNKARETGRCKTVLKSYLDDMLHEKQKTQNNGD